MRIAVDIDDTLYPYTELARHILAEWAGNDAHMRAAAYAEWPEWRTPVDLVGKETWERVIAVAHGPETILAQTPYPDAVGVLHDVRAVTDCEYVYISARAEGTEDATGNWLRNWDVPPGELICCGRGDKLLLTQDCSALIDDRPKTLVEFIRNGRKAFGLVKPYNRALTDVPGIYLAPTWTLLGEYLRGKLA